MRKLFVFTAMNMGIITVAPCLNVLPPVDSRCSDPAYRLAHPELCPVEPSLIIKPGIALVCQLGSIQFKAFLIQNGEEVDVTADSVFTSSDLGIAWVGVKSGNATGVGGGIATITATYQDKHASAEFNVMGCTGGQCDATVAMLLLVDASKSMSQVFSGSQTKLGYAKAAAAEFASTINVTKDLVGAMTFNAAGSTLLDAPTADAAGVAADIAGIAQTQQLTTFHDAFVAAIAELDATAADLKVLILFSDGEDTTAAYDENNNPLTPIEDFKAAGGIVMCLGTRAHGPGFNFLEAVATGGFFLNAYAATGDTAIEYLKGLRGYICAGNCTPAGDEIEYRGVSNWTGWINWDVLQGVLDLLGNGFYDVLPGNGLYMDLRGSPVIGGNYATPIIRSKNAFSLASGHVYRVSLDLAANQVVDRSDTVTLRVLAGAVVVLTQTISLPDYTQPIHTYAFSFTAPSDMSVKIEISQSNDTGTDLSETQAGVLLMRVRLEDTTDIILLLNDNFDTENPTYIPPRCGRASVFYSGHYAYGYNCYGEGCLDSPPGIQLSDPSPLPNLESGFTPPITYLSTKTACVSCPTGTSNTPTNLIPVMTGPSTPSGTASADEDSLSPAWKAFTGAPGNLWGPTGLPLYPHWLRYDFSAPVTATSYYIRANWNSGASPGTWTLQGSNNGSTWTTLDSKDIAGGAYTDPPNLQWAIATPGAYSSYRLYFTAPQVAGQGLLIRQFLLYGTTAPASICKTATATSESSQGAADAAATAQATSDATAELNCTNVFRSTMQYTSCCEPYHLFCVTRSATAISLNSQDEADANALAAAKVLADAARNCGQSTNNQLTTINDNTIASPYPSVKNVASSTPITKVTVSITNLSHFFPKDVLVVLQGPTGLTCVLQAHAGNAPAVNVSYTFDDAGGSGPPAAGPLVNGAVYKPSSNGAYAPLPLPGPAQPHGNTLSVFNGTTPSGLWALWIIDTLAGSAGTLAAWDLVIT